MKYSMEEKEAGMTGFRRELIEKSLPSPGNNYRMKKVIEKSRKGQEVTLVFLGASITMKRSEENDTGFATLSYQFYRDTYGKPDKVRYINSGLNGTSSTLGLIRVDRDVLNHKPDIVFVEFAVNDSKDSLNREVFESLILRLLHSESRPAVVLLFMTSETGYSCQGHMQVIGEHYQLPMISIRDAVLSEIEEGRLGWKDYSDDNIHPNEKGNRLVAECIAHYFRTVDSMPLQRENAFPSQPFFGSSYQMMKLLDADSADIISLGSFHKEVFWGSFKSRWIHRQGSGNESLKLKLKCRSLFAVYKENNNEMAGSAQVIVDGWIMGAMTSYRILGWGNAVSIFIFGDETVGEHTLEVKMAPGDEGKEFTLLGFGYCV